MLVVNMGLGEITKIDLKEKLDFLGYLFWGSVC
jgi:hypothetical protein